MFQTIATTIAAKTMKTPHQVQTKQSKQLLITSLASVLNVHVTMEQTVNSFSAKNC